MNNKILTLAAALIMTAVAFAQDITVQGTVTSKTDGEPLIGATVLSEATKNGVATDLDGNFTIKVPENSNLIISYVGYKPQTLPAQPSMMIELSEDSEVLDEVVVVGYTTQRKADLTGAVSVMDMKKPMSESSPNMLNSMQGRMPGVQIVTDAAPGGGSSSIRIRGISSINGSSPLYVIDGVATNENLNSLNPSDIESIQVLKDASSASIYGSRAANGVIIITTKGGKKDDKLTVNVNYSATLQTVAKKYDMLNAQEWGQAYWTANLNAGLQPSHPFYGNGATPQLVSQLDADGKVLASDTDWQDAVYHDAWTNNISASVTNSTQKGNVMFSMNYIDQNGLIKDTFYKRYSARVNSNFDLCKYIKVGENLMVAKWNDRGYTTGDERGIPFTAMRQHPAIPVYDTDGNFTSPMALASSDINNPVHELYNGRDNDNSSWRIFGNVYLAVMPVDGLTLKTNFGLEHLQYLNNTLNRKILSSDVSSVSRAYGQGDTWTWTNTANYVKTFADKHHLSALFGVEAIKYKFEDLAAFRNQYAFEDFDYMILNSGEGDQTSGGGRTEWSLFSYFGKVDYNFDDRYLAAFTIRRDQTSRLGKEHNHGVFPAFSAAWRPSQEAFFPQTTWLSDLKIRGAWGQNGNSAISNYAAYSTYGYNKGNAAYDLNGSNSSTVAGIVVASSGNPNLKWETTTQTNIGFDLGLFSNALSLSFDYYWKKTTDMLTVPPTLSVAGENAAMYMNTGDMKNTGFEVTLNYISPQYGDFSWNGNFNISHYKNEVVKLNDFVNTLGSDWRLIEGQPMGVYYGYVNDGIFKTQDEVDQAAIQQGKGVGRMKFRDINGDGTVDENDRCIIGDPNPDLSLGLNLDFRYKNFTLSTFFTGDFGFDIYNITKKQLEFMTYGGTSTNRGANILNAWSPSNPNSTIPALTVVDNNNETRMSTYFIEDGSYFKMKYIKLTYTLPQFICKKIFASQINVYAQVENLFTITKYSGLDPELMVGDWGQRVDNGPYPRSRNFTLGVNLQF